jgi:hypothetical protein
MTNTNANAYYGPPQHDTVSGERDPQDDQFVEEDAEERIPDPFQFDYVQ